MSVGGCATHSPRGEPDPVICSAWQFVHMLPLSLSERGGRFPRFFGKYQSRARLESCSTRSVFVIQKLCVATPHAPSTRSRPRYIVESKVNRPRIYRKQSRFPPYSKRSTVREMPDPMNSKHCGRLLSIRHMVKGACAGFGRSAPGIRQAHFV
jgi:hypothetical protein